MFQCIKIQNFFKFADHLDENKIERKKKKKKKVMVESDSDDSDSTVVYSEDLTGQSQENSPEKGERNIFKEKPRSHHGEFGCICGRMEYAGVGLGRKGKKHKVQCVKCGSIQHAECVHYDVNDPYRGEFMCPHCHVDSVSFWFIIFKPLFSS